MTSTKVVPIRDSLDNDVQEMVLQIEKPSSEVGDRESGSFMTSPELSGKVPLVPSVGVAAQPHHHQVSQDGDTCSSVSSDSDAEELPKFVLLPVSHFRKTWDTVQAVILMFIAVAVPLRVGLGVETKGADYALDFVIDVYFVCDIVLNFFTAYEDPDVDGYVVKHRKIALNYAKTWLSIDILSCLPVDLVLRIIEHRFICSFDSQGCPTASGTNNAQLLRLFKVLRLIRLVKLLRLMRASRIFLRYQDELFTVMKFAPAVKHLLLLFLLAHLTGCMFYFVSDPDFFTAEESANPDITTWVTSAFGNTPSEAPVGARYVACLYWSFTTLTTVGYGDISALTQAERVFALFGMIVGTMYFGYFIGSITNLLTSLQSQKEAHNKKMFGVRQFVTESKLPKNLRTEVLAFFRRQEVRDYNARGMLEELPFDVRHAILTHLYKRLITQVTIFRSCDDVFITEVCARLQPVVYMKGTMIYQVGEIGREMFIVAKGVAEVLSHSHHVLRKLKSGTYFGEGAVLGDYKRTDNVRARTACTLAVIKASDLDEVLSLYPGMRTHMLEEYAIRTNTDVRKAARSSARNGTSSEQVNSDANLPSGHARSPYVSVSAPSSPHTGGNNQAWGAPSTPNCGPPPPFSHQRKQSSVVMPLMKPAASPEAGGAGGAGGGAPGNVVLNEVLEQLKILTKQVENTNRRLQRLETKVQEQPASMLGEIRAQFRDVSQYLADDSGLVP